MSDAPTHHDLITALEALRPEELDTLLARARRRAAGPTRVRASLRLTNTGEVPLHAEMGSGQLLTIKVGDHTEIAADEITWPVSQGVGLAAGRPGFGCVPRGLSSLRILPVESQANIEDLALKLDVNAWHSHAARYGLPHGFARGGHTLPRKGHTLPRKETAETAAAWLPLTLPITEFGFSKQGLPLEIIVVGLGVDLSDMFDRFPGLVERSEAEGRKENGTAEEAEGREENGTMEDQA